MAKKTAKKTRTRYTTKEDKIILTCVKKYPTNIKYALQQAASKLPGRNYSSIHVRYYGIKSQGYQGFRNDPTIYALTTGSMAGFSQNVKNTLTKKGVLPKQKLNPVLMVVQYYAQVDKKQKAHLLAFLKTI